MLSCFFGRNFTTVFEYLLFLAFLSSKLSGLVDLGKLRLVPFDQLD